MNTTEPAGSGSRFPTRAVAGLLTDVLPRTRAEEIESVGHMAPITRPDRANPVIEGFLQETAREIGRANPTPVTKV